MRNIETGESEKEFYAELDRKQKEDEEKTSAIEKTTGKVVGNNEGRLIENGKNTTPLIRKINITERMMPLSPESKIEGGQIYKSKIDNSSEFTEIAPFQADLNEAEKILIDNERGIKKDPEEKVTKAQEKVINYFDFNRGFEDVPAVKKEKPLEPEKPLEAKKLFDSKKAGESSVSEVE